MAKQAARVLCESLLRRFPHVLKSPHPILTIKSYINAIQEFCNGDLIITKDEVANMLALLKGQELPQKIQNSAPSKSHRKSSKEILSNSCVKMTFFWICYSYLGQRGYCNDCR